MKLKILYRGPLSGCNYDCPYCPFAKTRDTKDVLSKDRAQLKDFVKRIAQDHEGYTISVLFTPWGEALIHDWYREAMTEISRLDHAEKVAIQTNLSGPLDWLKETNREKLSLWTTFHPGQTNFSDFLTRCVRLNDMGVSYSVGIVGLKENFEIIPRLREALSKNTYLWINAYKREENYYSAQDIEFLTGIDPLFPVNLKNHPSRGRACRAGESAVLSINGEGDIRPCWFTPEFRGNIYRDRFQDILRPGDCPEEVCRCFIGYVHLYDTGLYEVFGNGVLE